MRGQRISNIVFSFSLAFLFGFPGQVFATVINGTVTGTVTSLFESSETGEDTIFGFGPNTPFFGIPTLAAVDQIVTFNYQFNTDNAPNGIQSNPNAASCTSLTGRCIYDADRSPGSEFISATITLNGKTFNAISPSILATVGFLESTLTIENDLATIPARDHIDIRIDSTGSQLVAGVTKAVDTKFNTNLFRESSEGLTSDLSLTQQIDWDLDRDGIVGSGSNDATFSYRETQSPSCCGNGASDRINTVDLNFEITNWQQSPASNAGTTPENPVLPVDENGGVFVFDTPVNSGGLIFIDPLIAVGYDYEIGNGDPNFASALLPDVGDGIYDLLLFDQNGNNPFDTDIDILAGVEFDFTTELFAQFNIGSEGISKFGIRGIEISAGLDPNDESAFVTGLSFVDSGQFTGTMTPVTQLVQAPEPGTLALFGIGLIGVGAAVRRRCKGA